MGGLFPKDEHEEILKNSIGSVQDSANNLQWNMVDGLDKNKQPLTIVNSLFIGAFPKRYKTPFIRTRRFSHCENASDINVGYLNLFYVKRFFIAQALKKALKKWTKKTETPKVIIAYSMSSSFMRVLKYLKKKNPDILTVMLIADLPAYMHFGKKRGRLFRFFLKRSQQYTMKNLHYVDSFVLLTEPMAEYLGVKRYMVMEGVATDIDPNIERRLDPNVRTICYAGGLAEAYGVKTMVDAFMDTTDERFRLVLFGNGTLSEYIKKAAETDSRIVFKGRMPHKEVMEQLVSSSVLINPRPGGEEFTKYSFPSKNLESLSTGRPLIAYKLEGIPDEYDEYIYYVKDNSKEALTAKINEVLSAPEEELSAFGNKARDFVRTNKNSQAQMKRMLDMMETMLEERKNN